MTCVDAQWRGMLFKRMSLKDLSDIGGKCFLKEILISDLDVENGLQMVMVNILKTLRLSYF